MKTLSLLLTITALFVLSTCSRPASEKAISQEENTEQVEQTTEEAKEKRAKADRNNRDAQTIESYIKRLDGIVNLTDEQRTTITSLLQELKYESFARANQREMRKTMDSKITANVLTPAQAEAWEKARQERRDRNRDGGK